MEEKLYSAIAAEIKKGTPSHLLNGKLISAGWPKDLVDPAVEQFLNAAAKQAGANAAFKQWLSKYYRMARPSIAVVVGLNLFDTGIALLKPWPVKIMADSVFGTHPAWGPLAPYTHTVTLLAITSLMTISLFIFGKIFGVFRNYFILQIGFGLNRSIKEESLRHILHLPLFHQERLAKGDYVYRQNVVTDSLSELVLGTTSVIIQSLLVIFGVLIIMFLINPSLTLISVVLLPLLFVTIKIIGPKMGVWARKYTENASAISAKINESVNNAETVQAFTLEEKMVQKIDVLWRNSLLYRTKNMLWGELLEGINGFLVTLATSSVMLVGGAAALKQELSFGDLLIFMTYMGYLIGPVEQMIGQITSRNQKLVDVSRIYEVMQDHQGIEYLRQDNHINQEIKGTIEFHNVHYSYKDQKVLDGINFTIPAGQKIGIIGPSGGGKSTILKLIPLFIEPQDGAVTIDGINTQAVSLRELRKKIAWVSQTPQLFNENIFENLVEGDIDRFVSNEEIAHAVEVSNITEFVSKMPLAFRTPVGEDGGSLSGGQRQRVSIGRALIKDAPILCLDEPTAALDVKSENYIRDSLSQMIKGKTVVMVTHRKPLLDLMDIIYVLDNGKLDDVRNLGGLEAYLARLEGIEQKNAQEEIAEEHKDTEEDQAWIEEFTRSYQEQVMNAGNNTNSVATETSTETQLPQPTVQVYMDPTANNETSQNQSQASEVVAPTAEAPQDKEEVEIKLH
ncbi:ABC transporter ATP-binding protein [Candidatus Saccharibacteria bacterium]|nr:ABC transporter ATP-binding protein [Candidatus Saccharibacteria bacterium]